MSIEGMQCFICKENLANKNFEDFKRVKLPKKSEEGKDLFGYCCISHIGVSELSSIFSDETV